MLTIVDIQESDIGIMREDNKIVIIFRTPEVVEKIRQNIYLVEQAIEEANENVFRVVANMTPAAAK